MAHFHILSIFNLIISYFYKKIKRFSKDSQQSLIVIDILQHTMSFLPVAAYHDKERNTPTLKTADTEKQYELCIIPHRHGMHCRDRINDSRSKSTKDPCEKRNPRRGDQDQRSIRQKGMHLRP